MTYFYRPAADAGALRVYLNSSYADGVRDLISEVDYADLAVERDVPFGAHIFGAIDRLSPGQRAMAAWYADALAADDRNVVLNHPARFVGRFELLRRLFVRGSNDFNVYRVDEVDKIQRWPVFLRFESDHAGPRTPLLNLPEEVDYLVIEALMSGVSRDDLMICEFCDIGEDGVYRKYGASRFGDMIIPRHVAISRNWNTKVPRIGDGVTYSQEYLDEELRFMSNLPDVEALKEVFEFAGVQYGRIDYAYRGGRMQVWELNSNPQPILDPAEDLPERVPFTEMAVEQLRQGYTRLASLSQPGTLRVRVPFEAVSNACRARFAEII